MLFSMETPKKAFSRNAVTCEIQTFLELLPQIFIATAWNWIVIENLNKKLNFIEKKLKFRKKNL